MNKKTSYGIRAVTIAAVLLLLYAAVFLIFADLEKAGTWIGFGFGALSLILTGAGLWFGVTMADNLQTAANFEEAMSLMWLYPVLTVIVSVVGALLPKGSWKLVTVLELIVLALAVVYGIISGSAALRMTELDEESRKRRNS